MDVVVALEIKGHGRPARYLADSSIKARLFIDEFKAYMRIRALQAPMQTLSHWISTYYNPESLDGEWDFCVGFRSIFVSIQVHLLTFILRPCFFPCSPKDPPGSMGFFDNQGDILCLRMKSERPS